MEKSYSLLNTDNEDNWDERIALKVQGVLDDAGPSNMAFMDGPNDHNVNQISFLSKKDLTWILQENPGHWNHPCCQEIISKFLFKNINSLGHKSTTRFGPPLTTGLVAFGHTMVNLYFINSLLLTKCYCL